MDTVKIQERLDAIAAGMVAKAVPQPAAEFSLRSHAEAQVCLKWKAKDIYSGYAFFSGEFEKILAEAEAHVAALPSPEEARMKEFLSALGDAVAIGRKNDIDVDAINPLMALIKRLSKNALQHQDEQRSTVVGA